MFWEHFHFHFCLFYLQVLTISTCYAVILFISYYKVSSHCQAERRWINGVRIANWSCLHRKWWHQTNEFCDCKQISVMAGDNAELSYRICQRFAVRLWTRHFLFHFLLLAVFRHAETQVSHSQYPPVTNWLQQRCQKKVSAQAEPLPTRPTSHTKQRGQILLAA